MLQHPLNIVDYLRRRMIIDLLPNILTSRANPAVETMIQFQSLLYGWLLSSYF